MSFGGGDRGWVGDNPLIFLDTTRISATGWVPSSRHPGGRRAHGRLPLANEWLLDGHDPDDDGPVDGPDTRGTDDDEREAAVTTFSESFLADTASVLAALDTADIERVVDCWLATRRPAGACSSAAPGGGAGHASHATCDFRKLAGFEAYCVT